MHLHYPISSKLCSVYLSVIYDFTIAARSTLINDTSAFVILLLVGFKVELPPIVLILALRILTWHLGQSIHAFATKFEAHHAARANQCR